MRRTQKSARPWTDEETVTLTEKLRIHGSTPGARKLIAQEMGRNEKTINNYAQKLHDGEVIVTHKESTRDDERLMAALSGHPKEAHVIHMKHVASGGTSSVAIFLPRIPSLEDVLDENGKRKYRTAQYTSRDA